VWGVEVRLHIFLAPLSGGEWSATRSGHFFAGESVSSRLGGWQRRSDDVKNKSVLPSPGTEPRSLGSPYLGLVTYKVNCADCYVLVTTTSFTRRTDVVDGKLQRCVSDETDRTAPPTDTQGNELAAVRCLYNMFRSFCEVFCRKTRLESIDFGYEGLHC
jgi:hypothetical protein